MQYFFILGRNPTLSIAEIFSRKEIQNQQNFSKITNEFLILKTQKKIDCQELQKKLGGTIKIGEIISMSIETKRNFKEKLFPQIYNQLIEISKKSKKLFFGFSVYGGNLNIKELALEIKRKLKEKGIRSRWVESKERALSSVIVQKNKLLISGGEFCFLLREDGTNKKIYLGKTLSCQEFEEYEFKDFGRPARKISQGMIPPKLAKIMINLSQAPEESLILDPFCGSGTIIQEAILMGYKNIIATDVSREAVENTSKNIEWLLKNFKSQISDLKFQIFQSDVRNLSEKIDKNSIRAIITEPYLGPIKIVNSQLKIENLIADLSHLYLTAFREFKKILKANGKIVIIFPLFKIKNKLYFLPILDDLKKSGWQVLNPIPENLKKESVIKLTNRYSILYFRPDQKILREIFIFKKYG
ncbi:MAG: TRM11 family SAM-dependent methyltransferase [Patescibacteria group bacterium]